MRSRPVKVIKAQERRSTEREGKKPARPVRTGSASIPAPMQLPATKRMPPRTLPGAEAWCVMLGLIKECKFKERFK